MSLGCRPKVLVGRVVAKSTALHAFVEWVLMALTLYQQHRLWSNRPKAFSPRAIQCCSVNIACIYSFLAIKDAVDCLLNFTTIAAHRVTSPHLS